MIEVFRVSSWWTGWSGNKRNGLQSSQKGLTLVELLISMVCLLVIVSAVYNVFFQQNKTTTSENDILDMQLNAKVGMERLVFLFSHAGFGCFDSFLKGKSMSGDDPDGGTVTIDSFIWNVQNNPSNGTSSDSAVVVYGFRKVAEVNGNHNNTMDIDLVNREGPSITSNTDSFKRFINFYPNFEGDRFYEVSNEVDPIDLNSEVNFLLDDSDVYMVVPVRVKVQNNSLLFQNFIYYSNFWEICNCIQDIQLQYTQDGETWVDTPANPNRVEGVRIWLLARTRNQDPGYTDTKTYTLAGQTVGPFNDGYHRKLSRAEVWLRNSH